MKHPRGGLPSGTARELQSGELDLQRVTPGETRGLTACATQAHNLQAKAHPLPVVRTATPASDDDDDDDDDEAARSDEEEARAAPVPRKPEPRRYVVGQVGVRDFTLELYDCPVTLDRCFVGPEDLALDDHILEQYGEPARVEDVHSHTAGDVGLACAEKLIETLLIDHPNLALNLAAALSRDLVAQKTNASKPLKKRFLAHHRKQKRRDKRRANAKPSWFAVLAGRAARHPGRDEVSQ